MKGVTINYFNLKLHFNENDDDADETRAPQAVVDFIIFGHRVFFLLHRPSFCLNMFRLSSVRLTCNPEQELTSQKTQQRLNEVSHLLKQSKVLVTRWFPSYHALVLTFASGEVIWLFLNRSYLVTSVYIDKFLLKNKVTTPILDMYYGNEIIILANVEPFLTVITFKRRQDKFKLKYCDNLVIKRIPLRDNRRCLSRNLIGSNREDVFVLWWQCSAYGPTAWSTPDEPANVLIYSKSHDHNGQQTFQLQSYAWVGSLILHVS